MGELVDRLIERFAAFETIELTPEEELAVLNEITKDDFIDNGSSRAVYYLRDEFVVKIAMSIGGMNQNKIEKNFYAQHGHTRCFAHLYATGVMINIMEMLSDCQYYDPDAYCSPYFGDEEDEDLTAEAEMISNLIEMANDYTGYYGGDNGQIGFSQIDGVFKLYDYGYSTDYERKTIVDSVEDWMCYIDPIENAIRTIETGEVLTPDMLWEIYDKRQHQKMRGE